jgi:hypothetical protein
LRTLAISHHLLALMIELATPNHLAGSLMTLMASLMATLSTSVELTSPLLAKLALVGW